MDVFEVKEYKPSLHRLWREIYLLLFFNLGLIIGNVTFFTKYYLIIELLVFGILLYSLTNKRNRQINKLVFDYDQKLLMIHYIQFVFLKCTRIIPYPLIQYNYRYKIYLRGKAPKTLEFMRGRIFVAEIKQKYNLGWTDEEIDLICLTLFKIQQNGNNLEI